MFEFKQGLAHFYAEFFCFVGSRYSTTVVVRKDYYSFSFKVRPEYPLTTDKKIVAVGQGVHCKLELFNDKLDYPPDNQLVVGSDFDWFVFFVGGLQ